ncbi:protein kinase domain-containing protein [Paenibacillus gansuensis]|uniref:Protein kinase n=1 Tax=Paenibacillus gansuensis TaxID=306542 RepID=A0ABW5P896_9BACL
MTISFDPNFRFSPNEIITGKWNGAKYRIHRLLGKGANGQVYLVYQGSRPFAMKFGFHAVDLQSEVNVLKAMSRGKPAKEHYLTDIDDYETPSGNVPFYVMKYIEGYSLNEFIHRKQMQWLPVIGYQLLCRLCELHQAGWTFGDLKAQNVMVTPYGQVNLVDFGGSVQQGKSVRQFTEVYDRGYWGAGERSADEAYDLFSFAVLCLQAEDPALLKEAGQLIPQNRTRDWLLTKADRTRVLAEFRPLLKRMLGGSVGSLEAREEWRQLLRASSHRTQLRALTPNGRSGWIRGLFTASAMMLCAVVYMIVSQ